MSDTLSVLEHQRASLLQQFSQLPDLRPGSITGTGGRCGSPTCHCHRPNDPGHSPHSRLTYNASDLQMEGQDRDRELFQSGRAAQGRA